MVIKEMKPLRHSIKRFVDQYLIFGEKNSEFLFLYQMQIFQPRFNIKMTLIDMQIVRLFLWRQ